MFLRCSGVGDPRALGFRRHLIRVNEAIAMAENPVCAGDALGAVGKREKQKMLPDLEEIAIPKAIP
jgi:hypothetical protein